MFDQAFRQDRHLFDKIVYTVRMFHYGDILLLPHTRRIVQHRNRTRCGNSSFPLHFAFRIGSCIFSFWAHISSWSRTRDTTLIFCLNHGWNRSVVTPLDENVIVLLTLQLPCAVAFTLYLASSFDTNSATSFCATLLPSFAFSALGAINFQFQNNSGFIVF